MRVAINHTQFSSVGGSERYIYFLVKNLLADGHEVHYFCSRRREELDHERLQFYHVPMVRGVRYLKVLSFARNSSRTIQKEGPFDVIHGFSKTYHQDVYTDGSGTQAVYRDYVFRNSSRFGKSLYRLSPYQLAVDHCERKRFARGNFTKILTMSRLVKDQVQTTYGLTDNEIDVLYNGIDCDEFSPAQTDAHRDAIRRSLNVDDNAIVVLFVGSDYERKNLRTLLRAASKLSSAPEFHFFICGRDSHENRYRSLASGLGVTNRVHFLGLQKDIKKFFGAADVLVLPTYYDVFGMVVLEAMASGVPPIVSSKAGACEIIEPEVNGLILQAPEDADELANHLLALRPTDKREAMGIHARQDALAFSWQEHMRQLYRVYEQVIASKLKAVTA